MTTVIPTTIEWSKQLSYASDPDEIAEVAKKAAEEGAYEIRLSVGSDRKTWFLHAKRFQNKGDYPRYRNSW